MANVYAIPRHITTHHVGPPGITRNTPQRHIAA